MTDGRSHQAALRTAALLFILAATATVVAVVGRVAAGADQDALAASLAAIAGSRGLYATGGAARCVSGIALTAGAWCLHRAPLERRPGSALVAGLLAGSGMLTAWSGASAVVLAAGVPAGLDAAALDALARQQETTAWLRQATGGLGFAAAGLGLIVAGRRPPAVGSRGRASAGRAGVGAAGARDAACVARCGHVPAHDHRYRLRRLARRGRWLLLKGRSWWG